MIEVFQSDKNDEWYFRVKAENGEVVAQSEAYESKSNAERGADDLRRVVSHEDEE